MCAILSSVLSNRGYINSTHWGMLLSEIIHEFMVQLSAMRNIGYQICGTLPAKPRSTLTRRDNGN